MLGYVPIIATFPERAILLLQFLESLTADQKMNKACEVQCGWYMGMWGALFLIESQQAEWEKEIFFFDTMSDIFINIKRRNALQKYFETVIHWRFEASKSNPSPEHTIWKTATPYGCGIDVITVTAASLTD